MRYTLMLLAAAGMSDDDSTPYRPIDCGLYDYIEIACLYRYVLRISTREGEILTGTALDTEIIDDKVECLKLSSESGVRRVRLDHLLSMEPLTADARFGRVEFQPGTANPR